MSSRLFAVGLAGAALEPSEREILAKSPPWGVILFRRNLESLDALGRLVADLRGLGIAHLLLDQEGGPVDRLRDLVAPAPSLQVVARRGVARRAGSVAGAMLARLGFDVDLAPVVDRGLDGAGALVLGQRCASADTEEIERGAGDFLDGLHSQGVGGCLKHFPGLGRAALDTHKALPVLPRDAGDNAVRGPVVAVNAKHNIAVSNGRVIALVGVNDLVVVETADAILVCHRDKVGDIKKLMPLLAKELL